MPISNKNLFWFFRCVLIAMFILIIVDLVGSNLPGAYSKYFEDHNLSIAACVVVFILILSRANYFSYEDEYEIIHLKSRSLIFGALKSQNTRYEFPKRKIYSYTYKSGFLKRKLTLFLKSKSGLRKVGSFNLLFVNAKKIDYVINSLEKITKDNQEEEDQIME